MKKPKKPLYYDDDPLVTRAAIKALLSRRYHLRRPSRFHLKIDDVNYFPTKGTITLDPFMLHSETGLNALIELLEKRQRLSLDLTAPDASNEAEEPDA